MISAPHPWQAWLCTIFVGTLLGMYDVCHYTFV